MSGNSVRIGDLSLVPLNTVQEEIPEFLIRPIIPAKELTVIDADGGTGKSFLALLMCGAVNNEVSGLLVDESRKNHRVVILSAEDTPGIIKHRALKNIISDKNLWTCESGEPLYSGLIEKLEGVCKSLSPVLIVVDPITYLFPPDVKQDNPASVGKWLGRMRDIAQRYDTSIVLIRHLNKSTGSSHVSRGAGSFAIHARVRSALLLGKKDGFLHLIQTKSTNDEPITPQRWSFQSGGVLSYEGTSEVSEFELLSPGTPPQKKKACSEAIQEALSGAPDGSMTSDKLERHLSEYSSATIKRARSELTKSDIIETFQKDSRWQVRLKSFRSSEAHNA